MYADILSPTFIPCMFLCRASFAKGAGVPWFRKSTQLRSRHIFVCVKQQIVNLNHSCICLRLILSVDYNTPFTRVGAVELHFSLQDHGVKG